MMNRFFVTAALAAVIMLAGLQPVFAGQTVAYPTPYGGVVLNIDPEAWKGTCQQQSGQGCRFVSLGKNKIDLNVRPLTDAVAKTPLQQIAIYHMSIFASTGTSMKCLNGTRKIVQKNRPSDFVHTEFGTVNGPKNQFAYLRTINLLSCQGPDGPESVQIVTDFFSPDRTHALVFFIQFFPSDIPIWNPGAEVVAPVWNIFTDQTVEAVITRRVLSEMTIPDKVSGM